MRSKDQILLENLYTTILESFFSVPEELYKEIKDDVYKNIEIIRKEGRSRYLQKKQYKIDFTGTQWEFLNDLNETFYVNVEFSFSDKGFYREFDKTIHLGLNNVDRIIMDVLEHEFAHYIQYRIADYKKFVKKIPPSRNVIGGLPPKKYANLDNVTVRGYKKGSTETRRISHSHRPIEIYPDILSSVRSLQYQFQEKYPEYDPNKDFGNEHLKMSQTNDWEKRKKEFFVEFLKALDQEKSFGHFGLASYTFKGFKKISPEVYNFAKKKAYEGFMNYTDNFNKSTHKGKTNEIQDRVETSKRTLDLGKGKTIVLTNRPVLEDKSKESLCFDLSGILDWENVLNNFPNEKIPQISYIFDTILSDTGIKKPFRYIYKMPIEFKKIKKVFQRLNILSKTKRPFTGNPFKQLKGFDINNLDLEKFYKTIYKFLADQYETENEEDKNTIRRFIEYCYNNPKLSKEDKFFESLATNELKTFQNIRANNN